MNIADNFLMVYIYKVHFFIISPPHVFKLFNSFAKCIKLPEDVVFTEIKKKKKKIIIK